jgi:hypothetical protein
MLSGTAVSIAHNGTTSFESLLINLGSRSNFAIAGSFLIYLLLVMGSCSRVHSTSEHDKHPSSHCTEQRCTDRLELVGLIQKWRNASRKAAGSASGAKSLAVLGLFKVERMLSSSAGTLVT